MDNKSFTHKLTIIVEINLEELGLQEETADFIIEEYRCASDIIRDLYYALEKEDCSCYRCNFKLDKINERQI